MLICVMVGDAACSRFVNMVCTDDAFKMKLAPHEKKKLREFSSLVHRKMPKKPDSPAARRNQWLEEEQRIRDG